tara:strand:+ start:4044 stop:4364 length:321 start_codon:yes stop_codon:yes gene_type:complete
MPRTIWKYHLHTAAYTEVDLPRHAEVIKVEQQGAILGIGDIYLWVILDKANVTDLETVAFSIYGTGDEIPDGDEYIGTFFQGPFVWHVFKRKEPADATVDRTAGGE